MCAPHAWVGHQLVSMRCACTCHCVVRGAHHHGPGCGCLPCCGGVHALCVVLRKRVSVCVSWVMFFFFCVFSLVLGMLFMHFGRCCSTPVFCFHNAPVSTPPPSPCFVVVPHCVLSACVVAVCMMSALCVDGTRTPAQAVRWQACQVQRCAPWAERHVRSS